MHVSGDHLGQESRGYRWPYGPVALVTPFNFPIEIPVLQLMGALMMGNKPTLKGASSVSVVMDQFIRMMHHIGMPKEDVDMLHSDGPAMGELIDELIQAHPIHRLKRCRGTSGLLHGGKIRIEDAGFDWK